MAVGRPPSLSTLKSWQLKQGAFLLGLELTGTNALLVDRIQQRLDKPSSAHARHRIMSVDMGIRNLAFCLSEIDTPKPNNLDTGLLATRIDVKAWQKLDLLTQQPFLIDSADHDENQSLSEHARPKVASAIPPGVFALSNLAKIAYNVSNHLLSYKPDIILIERQRHRSGGASAILEWTVRVNMLESMLWACLHTIQKRDAVPKQQFHMHEVLPARVAKFWTAAPHTNLRPSEDLVNSGSSNSAGFNIAKLGIKKVEKKDKIDIARSWLQGSDEVHLNINKEVQPTAEFFTTRRRSSQRTINKLDDLADCLLQAAAWTRWQENAHTLARMLAQTGDRGRGPE